jgi:hypothetical protein
VLVSSVESAAFALRKMLDDGHVEGRSTTIVNEGYETYHLQISKCEILTYISDMSYLWMILAVQATDIRRFQPHHIASGNGGCALETKSKQNKQMPM